MLRLLDCGWRYQSALYRYRAKAHAWLSGGLLDWASGTKAQVPVRCDGIGRVEIGSGVVLGYRPAMRLGSGEILLQARGRNATIKISEGALFNNNVSLIAVDSIAIGKGCQIGDNVCLMDCDFHEIAPSTRNRSPGEARPVVIGDNVWLGSRVIVLKGVEIGDNTVVAAGSIVTRSLPSDVVAAGTPARVVRSIAEERGLGEGESHGRS
jgi:maltose O-acetyltransferase